MGGEVDRVDLGQVMSQLRALVNGTIALWVS
jgi:hypothetical protein